MKRAHVLALIRYAGYHSDLARMMRLYVENKVSYQVAQTEYNAGTERKKNGTKCNCKDCNGK